MDLAQDICREYDKRISKRSNWHKIWQIVGEYVSQVKQNFEVTPQDGEFLQDDVYDSSGTFAATNCASALLGMLWPGSAEQNIELYAPDDLKISNKVLSKFYEDMTKKTVTAMDDPKANLSLSLDEYMLDQVIFGTSGVGVEFNEGQPFYTPYGVKEVVIVEGRRGKVSALYIFFEWEVDRVISEYGEENVSEEVRKKAQGKNGTDKIKIIHAIRPRKEKKAEAGMLAMPYESVHVEYKTKHILKEEGFNELPIFMGRFRKLNYEEYGRSPAMNALPDIREANALREAVIRATEKNLDPPQGILDDGMLGGGHIDTSPGAINVFNASASIGNKNPIFPLVTVGSLPDAIARLEALQQSISQHFYIDRLLDFNNDRQMTFGETQIRDQIRTASLSSLLSRQIAEVFTPLVERTVAGMWRAGAFGVIKGSEEEAKLLAEGKQPEYLPDEIVQRFQSGQDVYKIRYKTKAASASRAQEYMSILDIMGVGTQFAAVDPSLINRVNLHEGVKALADIRGVPSELIRQDDEVQKLQQQQQQQQEAMMALQGAQQLASTAKDAAQAQQIANA